MDLPVSRSERDVRNTSGCATGTLVIGIGNSLMGDDGAGIHVISRLAGVSLPDDVEMIDGGTLSFTLLERVENAARLIIVDAAALDAEPGTVQVFHESAMDEFLNSRSRPSVHEVNLLDVLTAARLRGRMPARYSLVGIQPEFIGWSSEPSARVAAGIERAAETISNLLEDAA